MPQGAIAVPAWCVLCAMLICDIRTIRAMFPEQASRAWLESRSGSCGVPFSSGPSFACFFALARRSTQPPFGSCRRRFNQINGKIQMGCSGLHPVLIEQGQCLSHQIERATLSIGQTRWFLHVPLLPCRQWLCELKPLLFVKTTVSAYGVAFGLRPRRGAPRACRLGHSVRVANA